MNRFAEFRDLHHGDRPLLLPNAWDCASAAALAGMGFPAVATTSLGVAASSGKLDGAAAARDETLALAGAMRRLPCLVSVDAEGGFSERPEEVADLVERLAALGVVGVNLEDSRTDGTLVAVDRHVELVAAVKARVPDLFFNARIDTYWLPGDRPPSLEETIDRARACVAAGADGIFVPGVADDETVATLVAEVGAPLNVLFNPARHTLDHLAGLGVRRVSSGSLLFRVGLGAAMRAASAIRAGEPVDGEIPTYAAVQALNG